MKEFESLKLIYFAAVSEQVKLYKKNKSNKYNTNTCCLAYTVILYTFGRTPSLVEYNNTERIKTSKLLTAGHYIIFTIVSKHCQEVLHTYNSFRNCIETKYIFGKKYREKYL